MKAMHIIYCFCFNLFVIKPILKLVCYLVILKRIAEPDIKDSVNKNKAMVELFS